MKILKINFNLDGAKNDFVKSLSTTGFAVIENHDIDSSLISDVYSEWKTFFNYEDKNKKLFNL